MRKNTAQDVFRFIDMRGGDRERCWPWTGGYTNKGIPSFTLDGRKLAAYNVVFDLVHEPLMSGELARHKCDHGPGRHFEDEGWVCCNPYHLERGTVADNNRDIATRARSGLSAFVRKAIVRLVEEKGRRVRDVAELYGVDEQTVRDLLSGRTHVPTDGDNNEST